MLEFGLHMYIGDMGSPSALATHLSAQMKYVLSSPRIGVVELRWQLRETLMSIDSSFCYFDSLRYLMRIQ